MTSLMTYCIIQCACAPINRKQNLELESWCHRCLFLHYVRIEIYCTAFVHDSRFCGLVLGGFSVQHRIDGVGASAAKHRPRAAPNLIMHFDELATSIFRCHRADHCLIPNRWQLRKFTHTFDTL